MCPFCEFSFVSAQPQETPAVTTPEEPEWRREVARRLEVYRARRHDLDSAGSQPVLPFGGPDQPPERVATAVAPRTLARLRPAERVEIRISQPQLDFSIVENFSLQAAGAASPAARLDVRGWAGLVDAAVVLGVFGGFLELFRSMGGQLGLARTELMVYGITFFLIYTLYFTLFTLFLGVTPGMQLLGLFVTAVDGEFPEARQLLWRSIGYILSGGTLLLGFLWALWDEEHLTWQDRISQTYITTFSPADREDMGSTAEAEDEHHSARQSSPFI